MIELRQMGPIPSLMDLRAASCEAARIVRAGKVRREQAVDDLYRMAEAAGLVRRFGDDAVQKCISSGFRGDDHLVLVNAADVEMCAIDWLWPNRFALGKISLIAGLPDQGKGVIAAFLTAAVRAVKATRRRATSSGSTPKMTCAIPSSRG
jgi:hypothetical protein